MKRMMLKICFRYIIHFLLKKNSQVYKENIIFFIVSYFCFIVITIEPTIPNSNIIDVITSQTA